jgi:hypothetical protein
MDEKGYVLAIPPCVWGHGEGMEPPPLLTLDTRLVGSLSYLCTLLS